MLFLTVCRSYISHCVSKCVMSFCLLNDYWLIDWWKSMEKGENWPPRHPTTLNGWSPKFIQATMSAISTTVQNFIEIGLRVSVLRMRDFAPLGTKWLVYFFGSCERLQPRRAHRFWHKIRHTTRFRARKCLLGVAKPVSKVSTPIFPQKTPFRRNWIFFARKRR